MVMRVYAHQMRFRDDDATLVQRLQAGDERAFEAIFKRHQAPLLSYCRHMLGTHDEAEDALQQAFVKANQALLGGTAPRELRPWLYAIARNCCLTAIAARKGRVGIESLEEEDRIPGLAGLSEEVSRREDLRELVAGIGRLPEDQRSALLLAELDDLPHQAIASIVGCEVSKVKALIYQARSSLLADRDAHNTPCGEIREQLSVARGGELRRRPLRRHLRLCEGCRDFQLALADQRQSLALVLPVAPSAGLAAAILGHGASAHTAATAAGIGHAGGVGAAGGSTGIGSGAAGATGTASVTGAATGGTGAAASGATGLAASGTAATTTAVGAGAGASAGGGTSIGALLGGGLVTKLAVSGAVVALATAGAVTVHNREARASSRGSDHALADLRPAAALGAAAGSGGRTEIADSGLPASGSTASLELDGTPGPTSPASLTEPSGLGSSDALLTSTGSVAASAAAPGSPAAAAASGTELNRGGAGGAPRSSLAARAQRRATLLRRQALLRRRALLRRQALLRRRAALLRRERLARRRARRKALKRKPPPVKSTAPQPIVTSAPAPVRTPHRKGDPAPISGAVGQPGTSAKESEAKEAREAKAKQAREVKEAREAKEAKEAKEAEEAREAKEVREKKAREAREAKEAREAEETKKAKEAKEAKEAREKKAKEAKEAAQPTNLESAPESQT